MQGRKPHPFQLIDENNKLSKAKIAARKRNQPQTQSSKLWCPTHLCDEAKKEWRRVVKLYRELDKDLISDLDVASLEVYCESVATYQKAMSEVHKTTEVYMTSAGPKTNPWLTVANNAAIQIKRYGEVLLLDPVSRARAGLAITKTEEKAPSGVAAFQKRRAQ
jgi:P27 family predicted phage terminase small subunit